MSSARLTPVMRPIQPTVKRPSGTPIIRRSPRPRLRRRVDALLELDAEADHGELLPRRDAERDEVVAHLGAHRDERRRRGGEAPLEHPEEAGADGAEVAAQDVAVEGVHDDRRPCVTREQRRRAADGAGLRGVRVEDVRPQPADQPRRADAPPAGRGAARSRGGGRGARPPRRPPARRRTTSSPRRARASRRRASSRSRAPRGPPSGTRRAAPGPPLFRRAIDAQHADRLRRRQGSRPSGAARPRAPHAAPSRAPRGRRSGPPTSCGCRRRAAAVTSSRAACRGAARSRPRAR